MVKRDGLSFNGALGVIPVHLSGAMGYPDEAPTGFLSLPYNTIKHAAGLGDKVANEIAHLGVYPKLDFTDFQRDRKGKIFPFPMIARGSPALEDLERHAAVPILVLTSPSQSVNRLLLQVIPGLASLQVPAISPQALSQLLATPTVNPDPMAVADSSGPETVAPTTSNMIPISELGQQALMPTTKAEPYLPTGTGALADVWMKQEPDREAAGPNTGPTALSGALPYLTPVGEDTDPVASVPTADWMNPAVPGISKTGGANLVPPASTSSVIDSEPLSPPGPPPSPTSSPASAPQQLLAVTTDTAPPAPYPWLGVPVAGTPHIAVGLADVSSTMMYVWSSVPAAYVFPDPKALAMDLRRTPSGVEAGAMHVGWSQNGNTHIYVCGYCSKIAQYPSQQVAQQQFAAGRAACPVVQAARAGLPENALPLYMDVLKKGYGCSNPGALL